MKTCFSCFQTYGDEYSVCPHCGKPDTSLPKEPIHLMPGTVLAGRYIVGQSIGSGGFGIVYKAWDTKFETIVAVKEFYVSRLVTRAEGLKSLIVSKKSFEEFEYRKERFLAEAKTMAKFGSHKNIPNVFEFFEENNTAYIVMELLNGIALNSYMHQLGGHIDNDFALLIANEVGNALKSLHENNIIHRDVAPDNIYICSEKEIKIKLMDLGAAKLADNTDEVIDIILKPGYSPIEQYDHSQNIGPYTDIYALGATLYVLFTGVKPDESTNRKIHDELVPPNQLNPSVPENLSNAIMKAIAIDKHMRFKSVSDFLRAINGEKKVHSLEKERKKRRSGRFFSITLAFLLVFLSTAAVYFTFGNKKDIIFSEPTEISVWFAIAEGSGEEDAMKAIKADFESKFENVTVTLLAIPESEYEAKLSEAAKNGTLPTLFESSGLSDETLASAHDLKNVISSEQFQNALFLDQYKYCYEGNKQIPLAIEVPLAYMVTSGNTSVNYTSEYFSSLSDFGDDVNIALHSKHSSLIKLNFNVTGLCSEEEFLNNEANTSPVMLSSTMSLNVVRTTLTNYEKAFVYSNADTIYCSFIYEWSMGGGDENQLLAGETLLSWMLGNVYQNYLMISEASDGQIPINPTCFESKIESKYLSPIKNIHERFKFKKGRE